MLTERRISRRLFAAFAVIAVAFVASGGYVNWLSVRIDDESETLVTNALPSIAHLGFALDGLSGLDATIDEYARLAAAERETARSGIEDLRRRVDTELTLYRKLPTYPGEDAVYQDEPGALRRVDAAIEHVVAASSSGDDARVRATVEREARPRIHEASAILRQLIQLNAVEASDGATRIQATRQDVAAAALVLNVGTLLLTAFAALWLWRVFRSFSRLREDHARLLERRAQELEVFGSRVAHDLLSPLASLTFCLASFKSAAEGDSKLRDALRRARQCAQLAQGLINALFEFARSGGEPAPGGRAEVREVVQQVVDEARTADPAAHADIEVEPLPACAVRCTNGVLAVVLGNLVRNALKFTRDAALRRVTVRVRRQADRVRFEVHDTGPGIPRGLEQAIFEPYMRATTPSQPGLGLGLATVKRLCEAHGGEVSVSAAPEGGAIFAFTLPLDDDDGTRASSRERVPRPHATAS